MQGKPWGARKCPILLLEWRHVSSSSQGNYLLIAHSLVPLHRFLLAVKIYLTQGFALLPSIQGHKGPAHYLGQLWRAILDSGLLIMMAFICDSITVPNLSLSPHPHTHAPEAMPQYTFSPPYNFISAFTSWESDFKIRVTFLFLFTVPMWNV